MRPSTSFLVRALSLALVMLGGAQAAVAQEPPNGQAQAQMRITPPQFAAQSASGRELTRYPPWDWPETLPYYDNRSAPQGYHLEMRKERKLLLIGGVLFATAWGVSVLEAAVDDLVIHHGQSHGNTPLVIPVVGPFITLRTSESASFSTDQKAPLALLVLLDGLVQTTGVALFIGGMASDHKVYVRNGWIGRDARISDVAIGPRGGSLGWAF
jgi:hypothetical protein